MEQLMDLYMSRGYASNVLGHLVELELVKDVDLSFIFRRK